MKIIALCLTCHRANPSWGGPYSSASYYEDRVAIHTCSRGHKSFTLLQSQKFEVLLESGASALMAGYTVEAASSTAAALERYFEFAMQVLLAHRGMAAQVHTSMFKEMSSQSERQIGAFMALWALEFGEPYRYPFDYVKNRNRVVHKGHMQTPDECEAFCGTAYGEIVRLQTQLRARCREAMLHVVSQDLMARRSKLQVGPDDNVSTAGVTFYNIAHTDSRPSYREALTYFSQVRAAMEQLPQIQRFAQAIDQA